MAGGHWEMSKMSENEVSIGEDEEEDRIFCECHDNNADHEADEKEEMAYWGHYFGQDYGTDEEKRRRLQAFAPLTHLDHSYCLHDRGECTHGTEGRKQD